MVSDGEVILGEHRASLRTFLVPIERQKHVLLQRRCPFLVEAAEHGLGRCVTSLGSAGEPLERRKMVATDSPAGLQQSRNSEDSLIAAISGCLRERFKRKLPSLL
jgi:hypothetical protein